MRHPTDRITHTTAFVTPVVEHWLEREIAQWVHPMNQMNKCPRLKTVTYYMIRLDVHGPLPEELECSPHWYQHVGDVQQVRPFDVKGAWCKQKKG